MFKKMKTALKQKNIKPVITVPPVNAINGLIGDYALLTPDAENKIHIEGEKTFPTVKALVEYYYKTEYPMQEQMDIYYAAYCRMVEQNPCVEKLLLSTYPRVIMETQGKDPHNVLGSVLMDVREYIRHKEYTPMMARESVYAQSCYGAMVA